jgi:hypothetical protein
MLAVPIISIFAFWARKQAKFAIFQRGGKNGDNWHS